MRRLLPVLLAFGVVCALGLDNGGFFAHSWVVALLAFAWGIGLALILGWARAPDAREALWIGLLAAFVLWTALSAAWSVDRSASLHEAWRDAVYVLAAAAFVAVARSGSDLVAAVWAGALVVLVYALGRYLLGGVHYDPYEAYLLSSPVGYANGVGALATLGGLLAFGVRPRPVAFASLSPFAAALVLSGSRGSALALGVGLAVLLLVSREPARDVRLALAAAPPVAVVAWLAHRSGAADGATHGRGWLALWILLGAAVLALAPLVAERLPAPPVRAVAVAGAVAAVAGIAAAPFLLGHGNRPEYWRVAWHEYLDHPLLGSGAGTFARFWSLAGHEAVAGGARDAHGLYIETLAEVGPLGLALLVAALALPLLAARACPPAAAAYAALLAHAAVDWDWELTVLFVAGTACAAACLVSRTTRAPLGRGSPSDG